MTSEAAPVRWSNWFQFFSLLFDWKIVKALQEVEKVKLGIYYLTIYCGDSIKISCGWSQHNRISFKCQELRMIGIPLDVYVKSMAFELSNSAKFDIQIDATNKRFQIRIWKNWRNF